MQKRALVIGDDLAAKVDDRLSQAGWSTALLPDRVSAVALVREFRAEVIVLCADLELPDTFSDLSGLLTDPLSDKTALAVVAPELSDGAAVEALSMGVALLCPSHADSDELDTQLTAVLQEASPGTPGAQGSKLSGKAILRRINRYARAAKADFRMNVDGLSQPAAILFANGVCTNAGFKGQKGKAALNALFAEAGNSRLKYTVEGYTAPHHSTLVGGPPDGMTEPSMNPFDGFAEEAEAALDGWGFEQGADSESENDGEEGVEEALLFFAPTPSTTGEAILDEDDALGTDGDDELLIIDDETGGDDPGLDFDAGFGGAEVPSTDVQGGVEFAQEAGDDEDEFELPPSFQNPGVPTTPPRGPGAGDENDDDFELPAGFGDNTDAFSGNEFIDISVELNADQVSRPEGPSLPPPTPAQIDSLPPISVAVVPGQLEHGNAIVDAFTAQGWRVSAFEDGIAGVTGTLKGQPDVVVSATQVARLNGWGITAAVRGDFRMRGTLIVLLGDAGNYLNQLRTLDVGADAYLEAGSDSHLLVSQIRDLVTPRRNLIAALEPGLHFSGQVRTYGIAVILRAIAEKGVTGQLEVSHRYGRSLVAHRNGVIVAATLESESQLTGEDAIKTLLLIDEGSFTFDPTAVPPDADLTVRFTDARMALAQQMNTARKQEENQHIQNDTPLKATSDALAQFYLVTCPPKVRPLAGALFDGTPPNQLAASLGANPKVLEALVRDLLRKRVVEHSH